MSTNEAIENYLEAILILQKEKKLVRMSDIATFLKVSKPSVNKAMNSLRESGYIAQELYGHIEFTAEGRQYANKIYERHLLFKRFLMEVLYIDEKIAEEDACHMEHAVSDITMRELKRFIKNQLKD